MIIIGFLLFFNFSAIRDYNKFITLDENIKYKIYPKNLLLKFFLIYVIIVLGYEAWDFIDILVIQHKVISFKSVDTLNIIRFMIDRVKDLGILIFIFSTIYILTRESVITENCIITRYGAYNIKDLNNIEIDNNVIKYELKIKSIHAVLAGLSFKKFKVLDGEGQEIFNYLKGKII